MTPRVETGVNRDDSSDANDDSPSPFPFATTENGTVFSSVDFDSSREEASPSEPLDSSYLAPASHSDEIGPVGNAPIATLEIRRPSGTTATVTVRPPRCIIGRGAADLVLDDAFVSPWHVQLYEREGSLILEDMGSYNGVFLAIADQLTLEDRDEIVMGRQRFIFRNSWEPPATADRSDLDVRRLGAPLAAAPGRLLHIFEGGRLGDLYRLENHLTIGREGCDVTIPNDDALSPAHAEISRGGSDYVLRDLDTDLGTFVRIHDAVELVDGDCFVVGRTRVSISYN